MKLTAKLARWMVVFITLSWASAAAHGQTLADIARQERARKRAIQSRIVVTEPDTTPGVTVTATVATDKIVNTAAQPKGPVDNKGRDGKYWRTEFERARQELKRVEDRSRVLDAKLTDLSSQLLREGIANREKELRAQIETTTRELAVAKAEVQASQQKIRDLEDELRRSGGLPGWAR